MADGTGTTIGKAYVQIMPSTEGMKANLTQAMGGEAESAGASAGNSFASKFKSFMIAAGIATAFTVVLKSAIDEGAKLQQSYMGGVSTIYDDAADSVRTFAKQASSYGMSMNDYSEQAVSFGASLKQAYGGDAVKAANAANIAIMDMSDNQAKMGTSIGSIQDAYQGFAKQNYTMLDNLKLGYGGTKTEMERLLADAEKISGVHYDISNLGDVYSAIHVIQGSLGLTGVAAEEASTTFSGSFSAMKSSAENFMGSLALGDNIEPALSQLLSSVNTFINGNLIPLLGTIGNSIITALPDIMSGIGTLIGEMIKGFVDHIPDFIAAGGQLIDAVISGITGKDSTVGTTIAATFGNALTALQPVFTAITIFVSTIWTQLQSFITWITPIIQTVATSIFTAVQGLVTTLQPVIDAIVLAFQNAFDMICAIWNFFAPFFQALWDALVIIFTPVVETLGNLFQTAWTVIQNVWSVVTDYFATIWNTIAGIFKVVEDVFRGDFSGAWDAIKDIVGHWGDFFGNTWNAISNIFDAVTGFFSGVFQGAWDGICNIWNGVGDFFGGVWDAISGWFTALPGNALQWGKDMIQGFIDGIGDMIGGIGDAIGNVVGTITDFLHFSKPDRGPLREYEKWMPDFIGGLASGISDNAYKVTDAVKEMASDMSIETAVSGSLIANESSANSFGSAGVSGLLNGAVNNSSSTSSQNLTVNVYPSEGMDEKKLAEYVMEEIQKKTKRKETVFG
jgi:phage-related protein